MKFIRFVPPMHFLLILILGFGQSNIVVSAAQPQRPAIADTVHSQGSEPQSVPDAMFAKPVLYSTGGGNANALVVADVNGDSKLDVLVANGSGVGVLLGNGDGTLQPAVTYGADAAFIAVADMNGDGKPDIVVTGSNLGFLSGNGDGTFQPVVVSNTGGGALAVADVNADGHLDVVITNSFGFGVFFGNGDGTFQPPVNTQTPHDSQAYAVADLNRDGYPDAVVIPDSGGVQWGSRTDATVGVLFGNGNGTFQSPVSYSALGFNPQQIVIADMNRDSIPDIVIVNFLGHVNLQAGSVVVLINDSLGHFFGDVLRIGGRSAFAVAAGDVNGDGVTDVSVVESDNIAVVIDDRAVHHRLFFPKKVVIADLNGDGQPDVVGTSCRVLDQACLTNGVIDVFMNKPTPTTTTVTTSGSPSQFNQPVTFTATITSDRGPVPDGQTVTFFDGVAKIGTSTTINSIATFSTPSLKVGTHNIKAKFPGCPFFKLSSGSVHQVVNP